MFNLQMKHFNCLKQINGRFKGLVRTPTIPASLRKSSRQGNAANGFSQTVNAKESILEYQDGLRRVCEGSLARKPLPVTNISAVIAVRTQRNALFSLGNVKKNLPHVRRMPTIIKSSLLSVLMMSCSPTLQANTYLGFNLGGNSVNIKKQLTYPLDSPPLTVNNYTSAYTNFHAQLFAGYRFPFFHVLKPLQLSAEANWDFFTGSAINKITNWFLETNALAKEKLRYSYAFFLLPEYTFASNNRFFIGPGFSQGELLIESSTTGGNVGVSTNTRRWLSGWGIKAGIGSTFSACTELLITYEFLRYDRMRLEAIEPLSEERLTGIYRPYTNLLTIGLKFNL